MFLVQVLFHPLPSQTNYCSALSWCLLGWVTVHVKPLLLPLLDPFHNKKNQTDKLPGAFVRDLGCRIQSKERERLSLNQISFALELTL